MDLDSAADELYGLAPGEFTTTRDRLAAEARQAGDKELAGAVKKLKRPTVAAWFANRLVRERPDDVERLVVLGQGLREAQDQLDAGELRRLSQQRHQVVTALVEQARHLAGAAGGPPISQSVARELEETLEAAMSDPSAGEALQSGRLTTAISYSGLGFADSGEPMRKTPPSPAAKPGDGEKNRQKEQQRDQQKELRDARSAATDARRTRDQHARRARQLAQTAAQRERRIEDLRRQVEDAEGEYRRAADESAEAERTVAAAEADLTAALARVDRAESALR